MKSVHSRQTRSLPCKACKKRWRPGRKSMSIYKYYSDGDLGYLATRLPNSTLSRERRNYHSDQRLHRHGQAQCGQAALVRRDRTHMWYQLTDFNTFGKLMQNFQVLDTYLMDDATRSPLHRKREPKHVMIYFRKW